MVSNPFRATFIFFFESKQRLLAWKLKRSMASNPFRATLFFESKQRLLAWKINYFLIASNAYQLGNWRRFRGRSLSCGLVYPLSSIWLGLTPQATAELSWTWLTGKIQKNFEGSKPKKIPIRQSWRKQVKRGWLGLFVVDSSEANNYLSNLEERTAMKISGPEIRTVHCRLFWGQQPQKRWLLPEWASNAY